MHNLSQWQIASSFYRNVLSGQRFICSPALVVKSKTQAKTSNMFCCLHSSYKHDRNVRAERNQQIHVMLRASEGLLQARIVALGQQTERYGC